MHLLIHVALSLFDLFLIFLSSVRRSDFFSQRLLFGQFFFCLCVCVSFVPFAAYAMTTFCSMLLLSLRIISFELTYHAGKYY